MATELKIGVLCTLLLGACGCFTPRGRLFTYNIRPYALPHEAGARVGSKSCRVDITQLKEPFSPASLSVMWSNRAVADAMARSGMTEIRYADMQTLSIWNGVYQRRRMLFYGD